MIAAIYALKSTSSLKPPRLVKETSAEPAEGLEAAQAAGWRALTVEAAVG